MASETTAAAAGAVGVRRDPMAMKPFVGCVFCTLKADGRKIDPEKAPKIFHVNWFRLDDDGKFMWPGFGDNMRVLNWILDRCEGKVDAKESQLLSAGSIDTTDLDIDPKVMEELLSIDKDV